MMFDSTVQRLRARKGIGLLELMLALAIIAVLIIMATRYYQSTARASRLNEAVSQINAIVAAASNWKVSKGKYDFKSISDLTSRGLLPDNSDRDPWGGAVKVKEAAGGASFNITMSGAGTKDCASLGDRFARDTNMKAVKNKCDFTYSEKGRI